jgi:hypothetical protein
VLIFGVRGGVSLSRAFHFQEPYDATTNQYTMGPAVELHLPKRTGLAFDALYRRLHYHHTVGPLIGYPAVSFEVAAGSWEFSILLKHRLTSGSARPYLGVGPTLNRIVGVTEYVNGVAQGDSPAELLRRSSAGIVFAAGVELRGRVKISPEIRYGRRFSENFGYVLRSNRNQLDFIFGITF